jgi:hypothetical protein
MAEPTLAELHAKIARLEKILYKALDTQRKCAIMFVDETQDAQGLTRTIPNRQQRSDQRHQQQQELKRQG